MLIINISVYIHEHVRTYTVNTESGQVAPKTSRPLFRSTSPLFRSTRPLSGQLAHSPGPLEKLIFCVLLT